MFDLGNWRARWEANEQRAMEGQFMDVAKARIVLWREVIEGLALQRLSPVVLFNNPELLALLTAARLIVAEVQDGQEQAGDGGKH